MADVLSHGTRSKNPGPLRATKTTTPQVSSTKPPKPNTVNYNQRLVSPTNPQTANIINNQRISNPTTPINFVYTTRAVVSPSTQRRHCRPRSRRTSRRDPHGTTALLYLFYILAGVLALSAVGSQCFLEWNHHQALHHADPPAHPLGVPGQATIPPGELDRSPPFYLTAAHGTLSGDALRARPPLLVLMPARTPTEDPSATGTSSPNATTTHPPPWHVPWPPDPHIPWLSRIPRQLQLLPVAAAWVLDVSIDSLPNLGSPTSWQTGNLLSNVLLIAYLGVLVCVELLILSALLLPVALAPLVRRARSSLRRLHRRVLTLYQHPSNSLSLTSDRLVARAPSALPRVTTKLLGLGLWAMMVTRTLCWPRVFYDHINADILPKAGTPTEPLALKAADSRVFGVFPSGP
jgi:hypothetical protein